MRTYYFLLKKGRRQNSYHIRNMHNTVLIIGVFNDSIITNSEWLCFRGVVPFGFCTFTDLP